MKNHDFFVICDFFTTREISIKLGICQNTIRRYIKKGLLAANKFSGKYRIRTESYDKLLSSLISDT